MTMLLFLGGPLHGQFRDVEQSTVYAPGMPRVGGRLVSDAAEPMSMPESRVVTYHRRRILVRGWRFPLNCMTNWPIDGPTPDGCILPGYVHGVPLESEPDRNAGPLRCTCKPWGPPPGSACHLDYCPGHGPFRIPADA